MPMLLPVLAVVASVVVGVRGGLQGGISWIGAPLLVGASLGWMLLVRRLPDAGAEREDRSGDQRAAGDTRAARRGVLLPSIVLVAAAVIAGVIIVGALAGYL